jgi:chemotaxis protein MotC
MRALFHALGVLLLLGGGALATEPATPDTAGVQAPDAAEVEAAEVDAPDDEPRPPYELTRSLQALQDQVAVGSEAANAAQRGLLVHIGEQLLAAAPEVWIEPANARAAIVYTLSGGRPDLLHRLIRDELLPAGEMDLAKGALAYAVGRREEAWSLLEKVDARALPASLGAHVALAQATLTIESDQGRAVEYLETARLLAPGTLIEEAALRRQLTVASAMADVESFMSLARQYVRRFPKSVYAVNFLRALPELWADLGLPGDAETFGKLETTVAGLASEDRRAVYLALAVDRLVAGETEIARLAATGASDLAASGSAEAVRAALYEAAAQVASPEPGVALDAIQAIDPASLSETDAHLHAAALAIADQVWSEHEPARVPEGDAGEMEASAVLERGRASIAAADALLEEMR